jgi:tRNA-specific 2-thiouridylase
MTTQTIIVGMSGGVDSSFAAAYLKAEGYDVIGIMLRLWAEEGQEELNRCCSPDAMTMARRVAALLDIPFYVVDAKTAFRNTVVEYFLQGYARGITPNPCIVCNTEIRWKLLLEQADKFDAVGIATGHYAQISKGEATRLYRGVDQKKDQSYVLSMLPRNYLERTYLPVGSFQKEQVRQQCKELGLPTASRPDSQDLCFLGELDYREFLDKYSPGQNHPGEIVNLEGEVIGTHTGLGHYTLGQRKGLRIAYKEPYYVLKKLYPTNQLVVGTKELSALSSIDITNLNWLVDPDGVDMEGQVKVRYSSTPRQASIHIQGDTVRITFEEPIMDIAPGQIAAIYQGEVCLGGGIIV